MFIVTLDLDLTIFNARFAYSNFGDIPLIKSPKLAASKWSNPIRPQDKFKMYSVLVLDAGYTECLFPDDPEIDDIDEDYNKFLF